MSFEEHTTAHGLIGRNHGYWACQSQMLWCVQHMNDVCALCWNTPQDNGALASLRQRAFFDANILVFWNFKCSMSYLHCMQLIGWTPLKLSSDKNKLCCIMLCFIHLTQLSKETVLVMEYLVRIKHTATKLPREQNTNMFISVMTQ